MRRSRDEILMGTARLWQDRSTCSRNEVGVVIALEGRIIATGYNGAPAGMPHCDHTCPCQDGFRLAKSIEDTMLTHTDQCPLKPCKRAVHAEANAIAFSARHGLSTAGATLYTTLSPCYPCSQLIVNAGLVRVVFDRTYRDMSGIELLQTAGIEVRAPKLGSRR